ncbi:DnaJ-domain-containing protein, partial [Schizopora paradoxa]
EMEPTHYDILCIPHSATLDEIKTSYRQLLLRTHPDKRRSIDSETQENEEPAISTIQEAYHVLSNSALREAYDFSLGQRNSSLSVPHSRPAHVVSLEDFEPQLLDNPSVDSVASWTYPCRCGSFFRFTEEDLDDETHLLGCSSCSETLYVGYELTEDENYGGLKEENKEDVGKY